jgi:glycine cleavage system aminomethyltransferase T/glycine/D-amino acid oxidase-like deaminating enzyme
MSHATPADRSAAMETTQATPKRAQVVIIGAGIVGCSAAYHLTELGWNDIVVLDQGPLFHTGGSTSHAPGLVFQTNSSKTTCELAMYTVKLYSELEANGAPCFYGVGSLEVAHTPERMEDLRRRHGYATSWGLEAYLIAPTEAKALVPLLDANQIYGAYHVPSDGIAKAVLAAEALARRAEERGAVFHGNSPVVAIEQEHGRVTAVVTPDARYETERVLLCAGIWGPKVSRLAGVQIPLTPVEHQYVRTGPLAELKGETREVMHPIVRHQDRAMYFRQHGDSYGIGSYYHEPLLVASDDIRPHGDGPVMPSIQPFTPQHFENAWTEAVKLMPPLGNADLVTKFNGMFSFTPDGLPVMGESRELKGFWAAEAIWVTHGGGAGKVIAEWMATGAPSIDLREYDLNRFDAHALSPSYVNIRGAQQYREVYDIIHPLQPLEHPRPLRVSPFHERFAELGAVCLEGRGWERPHWFEANEGLLATYDVPQRTGWAAQWWSPIIGAEALHTRQHVALYDMTPLTKAELTGPGSVALLQHLATSNLDKRVGSVTYTTLLDHQGGVKSDVTVTRLAPDRFLLGLNGLIDLRWIKDHLPADGSAQIRDVTSSLCGLGLWGPHARDVLGHVSPNDVRNEAFRYFSAQEIYVGEVPVLALRLSYVGELGWELYAPSEYRARLWDLLWQAGRSYSLIAAGRGAFDALRIEKGYRLWGNDMHTEYNPYEAGLDFTVDLRKEDFIGREALLELKERGTQRRLCCLTLDDPGVVVLGKEPIRVHNDVVGYVTSANYGYTVGKSIAYGYLPRAHAEPGTKMSIEYFGRCYGATVDSDPLFDPKMTRLRS